jgi:HEPN domain-containing protein
LPSVAAQHWIDKAQEDEQVIALVVVNRGPWNMAAYHVQQAIEKYIKALLVERGTAPPKSHSLPQLLGLLVGLTVPAEVLAAANMTSAFAWQTRYPGAPPLAEADVVQATNDLATIKTWVISAMSAS